MPRLDPAAFDPDRALVMGRFNTVGGHALAHGEPLRIVEEGAEPKERGEVTLDQAARLWAGGTFVYAEDARPTPVETPEQAAERLVELDDMGDDKFLIRAPWLAESETITGRQEAEARRAELVAAGIPDEAAATDPTLQATAAQFEMKESGSNGYYEITGPGLTEAEKVRGKDKAEARLEELRQAAVAEAEAEAERLAQDGPTLASAEVKDGQQGDPTGGQTRTED